MTGTMIIDLIPPLGEKTGKKKHNVVEIPYW